MFTNLLNPIELAPSEPQATIDSYMVLKMEKFSFSGNNNFTLKGEPNRDAAILFIVNGIIYFDDADVVYNSGTKTFTWKNSQIKLSETDRIMALYSEEVKASTTA